MANEQNLKPVRTKEEARARGRNGGIASGKARAKKKTCAEIAMRVINSELDPKTRATVEKVTGQLGDDESTLYAAALAQMVAKAVKGDVRAFREIQNVIDRAEGGFAHQEREDDALSKSLKELGESL